jgi:drug/metabolite transporter (DMT)-like permease
MGSAALSFLLFGLSQVMSVITLREVEWGLGVSLATLIGVVGMHGGIKTIGPVRTSAVLGLQPITAAALGHVLLGQALRPSEMLGGLLTVLAVIVLVGARSVGKSQLA